MFQIDSKQFDNIKQVAQIFSNMEQWATIHKNQIPDDLAAAIGNCSSELGQFIYKVEGKHSNFVARLANKHIHEEMGNYLSSEEGDYDYIIEELKQVVKQKPHLTLDAVEYWNSDEWKYIEVWEKVENRFTVKEFCDLVGIK